MPLRGVIPPLVTPFRADGTVDLAAFEANLELLGSSGLAGFLVLGSNGEAAGLEQEEKLELIATARRLAPGRGRVVGTGTQSLDAVAIPMIFPNAEKLLVERQGRLGIPNGEADVRQPMGLDHLASVVLGVR